MPYKTFFNWLFDGNINTPIPKPDPEYGIPDILKYDSPITHTYIISLFEKHGKLNQYLDEYFNNINLRYIKKEELFYYIKECVIKNKIKKYQLHYFVYNNKNKLFDILRNKLPYLKNNDISLLCQKIDNSDEKESIYNSLGITKSKKQKIKKIKINEKISLKNFIKNNFTIMEIEIGT